MGRTDKRVRAGQPAMLATPDLPGKQAMPDLPGQQAMLATPDLPAKPDPLANPDLPASPVRPDETSHPGAPAMLSSPVLYAPDRSGQHIWLGQQGRLEPQAALPHAALPLAGGAGQLGIPGKVAGPVRNPGYGPGTMNLPGQPGTTASGGARRIRHTAGHTAGSAQGSGRMLWAAMGTAAVLAAVIVGTITGLVPGGEQLGQPGTHQAADPPVASLAAADRSQAAQWARDQLSKGTLISCDPAMCAALLAHHYPEGQLVQLTPGAQDPLGADVVMATAAVRNQFGRRLAKVYAPEVEVVIGTGKNRIQVRAIPADGAGAYRHELRADLQQRRTFGAALLHNENFSAPAPARHQLAAGMVDLRLLNTLNVLADTHPLHIVDFVGAGPGASPGVPLRSADITGAGRPGGPALSAAANDTYLRSALVFLQAQRPPFLVLKTHLMRRSGQLNMVRIEFGAPSPLDLVSSGTGEPDSQP